jgi:hypothetical protein
LKDAGFEHYGSQLVGPKEAAKSGKQYAKGKGIVLNILKMPFVAK